jgi:hypothetical protein
MNSNNNWKKYSHSSQIPRKYQHQTDGDWDDIMSPDDYDLYLERRQYERSNRNYR